MARKHKEPTSPKSPKTPKEEKEERESSDGSVSEYNGTSASSSSESEAVEDVSEASPSSPISPKKPPATKKGKKAYQCNHSGCGRIFTTSGHLSRHRRIHSGVKNYRCPLKPCSASFFRSDNMMTHFKVHAKRLGVNYDVDPQIIVAASTGVWPETLMDRMDEKMEQQARDAGLVIGCSAPSPVDPDTLPISPKRKRAPKKVKSMNSDDGEVVTPKKQRGLESPTKALANLTHGLTLQTSPTKSPAKKTRQPKQDGYQQAVEELTQTLEMVQRGAQQAGLDVVGVQSLAEQYLMNLEQKIKEVDSPVTPNSALVRVQLSDGTMLEVLGPSSDVTKGPNVFMDLVERGEDGKVLATQMVKDAVSRCHGLVDNVRTEPMLHFPPVTVTEIKEEPSLGLFSSSMDLLNGLQGHLFSMGTSSSSLNFLSTDKFLTSATTPVTGSKDESVHLTLMETTPVSASAQPDHHHAFVPEDTYLLDQYPTEETKTLPPLPPQEGNPFDMVILEESPKSSEMPWTNNDRQDAFHVEAFDRRSGAQGYL
jgi:hypothetical protein